jgi:membrane protease subunit (stomatin/prohibitin family)
MGILQVIEFFDDSGEIIVARIPQEGSGEFVLGSQLIVQESQVGVFFRDGKSLDAFLPGRYTLNTMNLPLLGSFIGAPFGGKSPFRAYVYFVATKTFTNLGWGTQNPVVFRDADLRMVTLRANGSFAIRIGNPHIFLNTIVGTRGIETTYALEEYLRTIIVSRFNEAVGETLKSILDLPVQYKNISLRVKKATLEEFAQYGVQLVDLLVEAITPPPDVQEMINRATGIAAQDTDKYSIIAKADALRQAASNPGAAGEGLGAGMGLGLGFGMAKELAGQFGAASGAAGAAQHPGDRLSSEELATKLTSLKQLKDNGLITEADFEEQKRRLLSRL